MRHEKAQRWGFRRSTSLLTVSALVMLGLVGVPSLAVTAEECVPSDGTPAAFSAWTSSGFTDWQLESMPPADPDGETGENNPANLQTVGPMETREVGNNDATEGKWTPWTNDGDPIRTEENTPPGADTDTVRYRFLSATDPEIIAPGTHGQHYSLAGGSWKYKFPPGFPETGDPKGRIRWQPNTEQEPHTNGAGDPATWVEEEGVGLHYTSHGSSGKSDWFYYTPETPPVTDIDYLWQKEVRTWESGNPESFHTEYRWELLVRTYTPGEEPVECPSEPPVDGGDDDSGPGPNGDTSPPPVHDSSPPSVNDTSPPPVQVAGEQASVRPTGTAQVPTNVAAGLAEGAPTQPGRAPVGLLMVVLGALITTAALTRRRGRI